MEFQRRHAEAELTLGWVCLQIRSDYAKHFVRAVDLLEPLSRSDIDCKRLLATALSTQATMRMGPEDLPALERVRQLRAEVLAARPDSPPLRADLAQANLNVGVLYKWGGRTADAVAAYTTAANELDRVVEENPMIVGWRRNLARTRFNLAELRFQQGQMAECEREMRTACGHYARLAEGTRDTGLLLESGTAWPSWATGSLNPLRGRRR